VLDTKPVTQVPIFLLSLPRSGSTLVQRVLAAHDEISTTPEPWLLLPQIYAMREQGVFAEFGQIPAARAIREFADQLPGGREDYDAELRRFILALYLKASQGRGAYFLDKTPRYHFVADELDRLFPNAKYIFLWRNPVAVATSIVQTWCGGRWKLERWRADLVDGLTHIVDAFERNSSSACAVRYEDLVTDPLTVWPRLFEYLQLPFDASLLESFGSVRLEGRMGDRTGSREYDTISMAPLNKWRATVCNPMRKRWLRSYVESIGERRLATMGYDLSDLTNQLDAVPVGVRLLGSDLVRASYWKLASRRRESAVRRLTRPPSDRRRGPF
jgi:Sulfotransferase family